MKPEKHPATALAEACFCGRGNPQVGCTPCGTALSAYWCDVCQQEVPEKRCPSCGLKARKTRRKKGGKSS